jgi:hypothetical protein
VTEKEAKLQLGHELVKAAREHGLPVNKPIPVWLLPQASPFSVVK